MAQHTTVAPTDPSGHPRSATQLNTAAPNMTTASDVAAIVVGQEVHSQGKVQPKAAGLQQPPAETAPVDAVNSLYYNMDTADRPLSSFAQRPAQAATGGSSRAAAGDLGGTSYTQHDVDAEASAVMDWGSAPAAGKQRVEGILAAAAALTGTEVVPGQHQECYSAEPLHMDGQREQGYSAEAANTSGHLEQHPEGFFSTTEMPHEASPLLVPGNHPNQAGMSPQGSMLPLKSRDNKQQHSNADTPPLSPYPAEWQTEHSSDSTHHQEAATPIGTAGHAATAHQQRSTAVHDAGHVAVASRVDAGGLLPAPTGRAPQGHNAAASSQPRPSAAASAVAARGPNTRAAEGDVTAASPSAFSSSFLGQSLDLSKVSLLKCEADGQSCFCQTNVCCLYVPALWHPVHGVFWAICLRSRQAACMLTNFPP